MAEISLLAMERFFALLAVASATLALVIAGARFLAVGARFLDSISPIRVWLAWLIAAVATAGSLYFSENAHLVPCKLCWFQRIAMYPLALLLLIAAVRRDSGIRYYAVPMAAIGAATSAYHYLIEWRPSLSAGSCDAAAPCTVAWFRQFGFMSLPLMAFCGFVAIVALLTLDSSDDESLEPTMQVA
ncbi:MAG TPA: disulfide bond formation protein B [Ilumatobacteraceae bacterium]|jgi:disulfide bond formation protein DsbB|nr:disulfide bond formation protein B [Ilumatobacteraceae bacterium]